MLNNSEQHYKVLTNIQSTVDQQYKAIFELRTINTIETIEYLKKSFNFLNEQINPSCLLLHEIAYALGQSDTKFEQNITNFLIEIIKDEKQFDVVRHEAAEALANINQDQAIKIFQQYSQVNINDPLHILQDTCIIGLDKIITYQELQHLYGKQYLGTKEPAAPFEEMKTDPIEYIQAADTKLFDKYRALYYIRNNAKQYFHKIGELLLNKTLGALFKHEICFVIGQVGEAPNIIHPILLQVISDDNVPSIVRHEAIAAFQTISTNPQESRMELEKQVQSADQIVRETAMVSLALMEFYVQNI